MNHRFHLTCIFLILFQFSSSFGQKSSISGNVKDESGQNLGFASMGLLKLSDSLQIASNIADSSGKYLFKELEKGEYLVVTFLMGHKKNVSAPISLDGTNSQILDVVLINTEIQTNEVTVTGSKPLVRQEADRMIVDIENSMGNSGLNAMDLLRKSPGVSVDKDGKISIRGKKGVLVMIDDKPLYMNDAQIESLLKSVPSDQVKEIELITNPTAKYDASGSSGIINIKLKKSINEGLDGSITASYGMGVYHKSSQGINIGYKKNKFTLNTGYQYNNKQDLEKGSIQRTYGNADSEFSRFNSNSYLRLPSSTHVILLGTQYRLNKWHTLSLDVNTSLSENYRNGDGNSTLYKKDGSLNNNYQTTDIGNGNLQNLNGNLEYKIKLDTNDTQLTFNGNYNLNKGVENKDVNIQYYDSLNHNINNPYLFTLRSNYSSDLFSAKTDFSKTIYKKIKLETGLKVNLVTNNNPSDITITENFIVRDASNHFLYKENVYAAYAMINKKKKKWKFNIGLRLEHTDVTGTLSLTDSTFYRTYTNLFPSGNLSYNLSSKTMLSIAYSRRIQRPSADQLNPILSIVDPYTGWGGNPYLLPQIANNVNLNYSIWSGLLVTSLSYSRNTNHISYVVLTEKNNLVARGSFLNMKYRDNIAISFNINKVIQKWWTTTNFINIFYTQFKGGIDNDNMSYSQASWTATSTQTIKLPKSFGFELSGTYEAPKAQNAFGYNLERWQINTAVQKRVMKDKMTLKIAVSDIFWKYNFTSVNTMDDTELKNIYNWDNRIVMFTINYKFGKTPSENSK